jgi:YegS/Rv2252/BmrU family lipid kinase
MIPETLIIINNAAARARRAWPDIKGELQHAGIRFEVHETTGAGDATNAARNALRQGFRTIAAVGGDGTVSETAEGFFEVPVPAQENLPAAINQNATLAVLPAGTGDDFARGLIQKRVSTREWTSRLIQFLREPDSCDVRTIDAVFGKLDDNKAGFVFVNIATLGIGPEVAAAVSAQVGMTRKLSGEARFLAAACKALAGWRERRLKIRIDNGPELEFSSNLVALANSIYAGGGMMFAPGARSDDGVLDLLVAGDLNRRGIVRELPRIRRGGHLANPKVRMFPCTRVRIEHQTSNDPLLIEADGNLRGQTPVEFTIMPGAIRVLT